MCINDCAISGIVICFNIVIHVSLMFCCRFALSSTYGFGFVLFCFWSFSILWFYCLFSACSVVVILLFSMLFACTKCNNVFSSVTSFSVFLSVVLSLLFVCCSFVFSLFVVISAYVFLTCHFCFEFFVIFLNSYTKCLITTLSCLIYKSLFERTFENLFKYVPIVTRKRSRILLIFYCISMVSLHVTLNRIKSVGLNLLIFKRKEQKN